MCRVWCLLETCQQREDVYGGVCKAVCRMSPVVAHATSCSRECNPHSAMRSAARRAVVDKRQQVAQQRVAVQRGGYSEVQESAAGALQAYARRACARTCRAGGARRYSAMRQKDSVARKRPTRAQTKTHGTAYVRAVVQRRVSVSCKNAAVYGYKMRALCAACVLRKMPARCYPARYAKTIAN